MVAAESSEMAMTPNWTDLYLSIQACNAGYLMDADQEAAALDEIGCTVVSRLSDTSGQATVFRDATGILNLMPCGTRFSAGSPDERLADLLKDVEFGLHYPWNGSAAGVWEGAYRDAQTVVSWATPIIGSEPIRVHGHSLGAGAGTLIAKCGMIPEKQIIDCTLWESPKQGNSAFWRRTAGICAGKMRYMGHQLDGFWLNYPPDLISSLRHPPDQAIWLHDGTWSLTTPDMIANDGLLVDLAEHFSDHGPTSIVQAVRALVK
jgi:hypothetical protein